MSHDKPLSYAECCRIITQTYPADSSSNRLGSRLLEQARREYWDANWRVEPIDVLRRYAALCQQQMRLEEADVMRGLGAQLQGDCHD